MGLGNNFFKKSTIEVARNLIGCYLVHGECVGRIIETEAYLQTDPASHSFNGRTKRNEPMFGKAGTAYVYFTYGMHYCFNVVTNIEGIGEAVLIRAIEPLEGIELMKRRRGISDVQQLCNGPAKLVQAFGITKGDNGKDLINGELRIEFGRLKKSERILTSERIGITRGKELKYRFYVGD